jgi:Cro/C1-type HTH DNA-binding domain
VRALDIRGTFVSRVVHAIVARQNAGCLPTPPVTQPPLLIPELERLARERSWSIAALSERLGISPKSFYNLRLGHSTLSLDTLSRITVLFGGSRTVRELVLHYLRDEYPSLGRARRARTAGGPSALPVAIPSHTRWRVAAWVAQMPRSDVARNGLYLHCSDAALLTATARFVQRELERLRCSVVMLDGNIRLAASHARAAEEAAVLIVERVDHASDGVAAIILRRHEALRPTVVTSCGAREELRDRHVVRVVRAAMQLLSLDIQKRRAA